MKKVYVLTGKRGGYGAMKQMLKALDENKNIKYKIFYISLLFILAFEILIIVLNLDNLWIRKILFELKRHDRS